MTYQVMTERGTIAFRHLGVEVVVTPLPFGVMRRARRKRSLETLRELSGIDLPAASEIEETPEEVAARERQERYNRYDPETRPERRHSHGRRHSGAGAVLDEIA